MKEAVIVHLWEGYPEYSWYPKTKQELEEMGLFVMIEYRPNIDFEDPSKSTLTVEIDLLIPKNTTIQ